MSKPELYASIDIETNGPVPGLNSMLSLGVVLFGQSDEEVSDYYMKFDYLPEASANPDTMEWWAKNVEAYHEATINPRPVRYAVLRLVDWLDAWAENHRLVAIARPASFDFPFVNYYCHRFAGRNPFGHRCLDIRSYINGILNQPDYYGMQMDDVEAIIGTIDRPGLMPHKAVDDARKQGRLFCAVRRHVINTNAAAESLLAHNKKTQEDG